MKLRIDFMGLCGFVIREKAVDVLFPTSRHHSHYPRLLMELNWAKADDIEPWPDEVLGSFEGRQLGVWKLEKCDVELLDDEGHGWPARLEIRQNLPGGYPCPSTDNLPDVRWIGDLGKAWGTGKAHPKFLGANSIKKFPKSLGARFRLRTGSFGCASVIRDDDDRPIRWKFATSNHEQALADVVRYEVEIESSSIHLRLDDKRTLRLLHIPKGKTLDVAISSLPRHEPKDANEHFDMFEELLLKRPAKADLPKPTAEPCPLVPLFRGAWPIRCASGMMTE